MKTIHIYTSASLFPYNDATLSAHDLRKMYLAGCFTPE